MRRSSLDPTTVLMLAFTAAAWDPPPPPPPPYFLAPPPPAPAFQGYTGGRWVLSGTFSAAPSPPHYPTSWGEGGQHASPLSSSFHVPIEEK